MNPTTHMDLDRFRATLYGSADRGFLALNCFNPRDTTWIEMGQSSPTIQLDRNQYLSIGVRRAVSEGRGKREDIIAIPGLWVDLDYNSVPGAHKKDDLPPDESAAVNLLDQCPLKPSLTISSGHGLQAYWLFNEVWYFASDAERDRAERLNKGWEKGIQDQAAQLGWGMDSTADLPRVLRIPGSMNCKVEPFRPVTVMCESEIRYEPSDFAQWELSDEPPVVIPTTHQNGVLNPLEMPNLSPWIKTLIVMGDPIKQYASRSETVFAVINGLLGVGCDDKQIMDILLDPQHKISERPLEKGEKWLVEEIRRARIKPKVAKVAESSSGKSAQTENLASAQLSENKAGYADAQMLNTSKVAGVARVAGISLETRIPDPLRREMPPPEPFPIGALGNVMAGLTRDMQRIIRAPDAICGNSALAAGAYAAQAHGNVVIDGRVIPLSEYIISLGLSGERKTATDACAVGPHRQREKELTRLFEVDNLFYKNLRDAYKKSREVALKVAKSLNERQSALEELGMPPVAPLTPLLLAGEPTYEGLIRLFEEGQPSLGLFSNEGGRLVGGHGMQKDNQLKTAAGLSELWDGQRIDRVRSGDGASALYGRRLTTHLMMQPGVAQLMLGNALLLEQGLLSRCLVAYPETTSGTRFYREIDLSQEEAVRAYNDRMSDLLNRDLPLVEGKLNELNPPAMTLTGEAKVLWISFHNSIEKQLAPGGDLEDIRPFASKAAEHALRLSGVITKVENPEALTISLDAVTAGIDLVEFYISEALRMWGSSLIDPELVQAEALLLWAQQHEIVHLRQIYQYGPTNVRDAKTAQSLVTILEEHGWFVRVQGGAVIDGAARRDVWEVYRG